MLAQPLYLLSVFAVCCACSATCDLFRFVVVLHMQHAPALNERLMSLQYIVLHFKLAHTAFASLRAVTVEACSTEWE